MAVFQSKKYVSSAQAGTSAQRLRVAVAKHPFLLFGLPFITTMVAGSFFLTPATALRYERHDRKVKQLSQEEGLGIGKDKRKVDLREEYYRLSAKDLDNWEQKRIKRLPGEPDGILE
ncbi:cytochrome c oxidase-like protein [Myriangium duriaei CBS 260.36]|uniref:Cytochrome c oxidase assembly protein COX16, mitochondrial n=1 Tax=Myriangium duriaei CBS 260.36 TaxID=1168546 RepID=A0A9P4ITU6_9PEZI|nr:cytochrome c oxidase-like protein [Myriangium duriaei CBS 260.36]